jgi:hypothetical protein
MSRRLLLVAACLVVGSAVLRADPAKEVKIIASAQESSRAANIGPVQLDEPGTAVIRSTEELVALTSRTKSAKDPEVQKAMMDELAKILEVDAIDWSKQMVVAVRGEQGTKADKVHFNSLTVEDKILTVSWKVKARPPHAGPGTPIALILIDRFDGEVKFVPSVQQ